ncbi:MAG: ABC transporter substrate-binding protein [Synechococcus sp.]|nr:ABC transporter substrate-binding protein [Synechococcus sp.]
MVRVLMPAPFAAATHDLVAEYNRSQATIQIEVEQGPLDTEAISDLAISSLLLGDTPYDLLLMDVTWTPKYAAAGWLEPLEPWLGSNALEPLVPGAQLGNAFGGHLWRMPLLADTGLLFYRSDLLDAPPLTTTDLVAQAERLQRSGAVRWGFVWQGRQYEGLSCVFLEVLRGFGGHWIEGTNGTTTALNSGAAQQAAAWLNALISSGISPRAVVNMSEQETLQSFAAGEALFMRNWPYAWAELQKPGSAVAGKVGVSLPVAAPGQRAATTQGSWGFSLLKGSRHPAAAAAAIAWFSSAEVQRQLSRQYGYTPTLSALFDDPTLVAEQPLLPVLRRALDHAVLRPETPLYAQLSDLLQRRLSAVFTAEQAVPVAMQTLQQQSELLLRSAGATAALRAAP